MRLRARGAGSARLRRRLCAGLGAGLLTAALAPLAACAPPPAHRTGPGGFNVLGSPLRVLTGAQLMQATATGLPQPGRPLGGLVPFVFPVAVAVSPLDLYVADAGAGRLYRYTPSLDAMTIVAGAVVTPQTRLAAGVDGSVLVTTPQAGAPARFDRAGHLLPPVDGPGGARYDEVVIDADSGRFYALDRVRQRIDEIMPTVRRGIVAAERLPNGPVHLAIDRHVVFVGARGCRCVVAIDPRSGEQREIVSELADVGPLAAGGGWLIVADPVRRRLLIHRDGVLRGEPSYAELKVADLQGLALVQDTLYVADGAGRRVASFRLLP